MAKCATCGKYLAAKEVAACSKCNNKYHFACAHLKEPPKTSSEWRCQHCKKVLLASSANKAGDDDCGGTPSSLASTTASNEEATEQGIYRVDLSQEIRLFRKDLQQMKEELKAELREIRQEVADLRQTVATCSKRMDSLESRIVALESRQEGPTSENLQSKLEQTVAHLKFELNDREQELLSSDLEIANLPEDSGENVVHTVELVARKLGVSLEARDIVFAERVGPKPNNSVGEREPGEPGLNGAVNAARRAGGDRGRRIVVRLARRGLRDQLLDSARVRRNATSADLGFTAPPRRFYLNERLTRANKQLFYRARLVAGRLGWRYTWTKRGRILTKQGDGKRTYVIRSDEDLEHIFGSDALKECVK